MSESIPKMLKYSQIKPKGIPTKMKRVEINQVNSQAQLNFNDIIRFQFQTDQFIDPYSAYLEIQIEIPQSSENMPKLTSLDLFRECDAPLTGTTIDPTNFLKKNVRFQDFQNIPLYILDGPSTSLISEMTFYSNGREIERIDEYDQLGCLINDIGIDSHQKARSGYYGLASSFGKTDFSFITQQMSNYQENDHFQLPVVKHSGLAGDYNKILDVHRNWGTNVRHSFNIEPHMQYGPMKIQVDGQVDTFSAYDQTYYTNSQLYKSPISDYLNLPITTQSLNQKLAFYNNPSSTTLEDLRNVLFQNLQVTTVNQLVNKFNNCPGLFPIDRELSYIDALSGFTRNHPIYLQQQCLLPKQYINYAREFALQDGQYGIEHYKTVSSTAFNNSIVNGNFIRPVVDSNIPATSELDRFDNFDNQYANQYVNDINDLQNTDINTHANSNGSVNQTIKRRKRILYNNASNQNNFQYWAPGIAQQRWKDGKPVLDYSIGATNPTNIDKEQKYGVTKKTFYIPLLSGVLGHLIPQDQWRLIPGKGCGNMTWEFRLNRYAIFMSGHKQNDGVQIPISQSQLFHNGNTARDGWNVKKISMHFQTWDFEQSIHQMVDQQLKEGIIMNSQSFLNGPTYSIQSTSQLKGSWQINNSVQSVKNIYFWFLLDDYQKYNFCRKQFRISHNLKSMQLKLGTEFIPEQPIIGHAGNLIEYNDETHKDVTPFYTELLRTQGEFLTTKGKCQILPQNFIVNERAYDPDNPMESQFQTAFLHETRLVGKALYCFNLEPDQFDFSYLSGKNISSVRPVEIVLDTHFNGQQTRPSTMYCLIHADSIVSFTDQGIQIAV